ncbi:hypothetical protein WJX73_009323 [Symbiochloris irregularis]|uniref:Uncharacterized protein n=1 Tax=Symbiochloris irregularis TaxID=706552 RepID=A0AAW1NWD5_9CHLO
MASGRGKTTSTTKRNSSIRLIGRKSSLAMLTTQQSHFPNPHGPAYTEQDFALAQMAAVEAELVREATRRLLEEQQPVPEPFSPTHLNGFHSPLAPQWEDRYMPGQSATVHASAAPALSPLPHQSLFARVSPQPSAPIAGTGVFLPSAKASKVPKSPRKSWRRSH